MNTPTISKLKDLGVITKGHFIFSSGLHSRLYFNKCRLYEDPEVIFLISKKMAEDFKNSKIDLVVGPATGGIILSTLIAKELGTKGIWADKVGDDFAFKRHWSKLIRGKKILAVEDVVTTGNSINKVLTLIRELGGDIIGLTAIANRNPDKIDKKTFNVSIFNCLYELDLPIYTEKDCPLCKQKIPINTELGHGEQSV